MTQLFSVIMVIVMAFSSVAGMTAGLEETVSFEAQVSVDTDAVLAASGAESAMEDEVFRRNAKLLEDVLAALTLKGTADRESAELALFSGSDVIFSLGVKKTDGGAAFASSLLGSQTLFFSDEMIQRLQQQMADSMEQNVTTSGGMGFTGIMEQVRKTDWEQLGKDVSEAINGLMDAVMARNGEAEEGEYTADGGTFTKKVPNRMTYDELTEAMLLTVKDLLGRESVQPLARIFIRDGDPARAADRALEELKKQPAGQKTELTIATYTKGNGSENAYLTADAVSKGTEGGTVKENESVHLGMGLIDGRTRYTVTSSQASFDMTAGRTETGYSLNMALKGENLDVSLDLTTADDGSSEVTADVTVQGVPVRSHTVTAPEGDRWNFRSEVFMVNMEQPAYIVTGSAGRGGETVSRYEGDGITAVPFEQLMSGTDTTAAAQLQLTMTGGLLAAISALGKNLPEDSAAALSELMKQTAFPAPAGGQ